MISLGKGEETVYVLEKHWLYFILIPLVATILSGGILFPVFFYRFARYKFDEIVVTNQKFHIRVGLINKEVMSTPLKNINNVTFQQGLFGRIFGYGTVNVHSGALGVSSYSYIVNPELAKASIEQAIANQTTKVTLA
ncbi:MAG: PH domain-containing protein [Selenomonadaceae bacterium]|nr:PH domain-containing protein [Selenomonadaceae bacterium]